MAEALTVGSPPIEVRIRRNQRARRLVLRVGCARSGPTLTLPPGVSTAAARTFLHDHEAWLRSHLGQSRQSVAVRDGTLLPFGDGEIRIVAAPDGRPRLEGDLLMIPGRPADLPVRTGAFLREAARAACVAAVARHAPALGHRAGRISLRDPRARWGSCTSAGDLMFSWRLVLAPAAVLDYVVAHEVAHLAEMNHSPRFWARVRALCPDYGRQRAWLRQHGPGLHAFDFSRAAPD